VRGLDASDLAADRRITLIARLDDGSSVIETPRYRAFTEILQGLARRGRDLVEIAGNDDVLVTMLARDAAAVRGADAVQLFAVPVQARPGWHRLGLDAKVSKLLPLMRQIEGTTIELEHVYDY
jgi:hypothetical protein